MQLISQMDQIFTLHKCHLWLCPYEIMATGPNCGLIEVVDDALSIHALKEKLGDNGTLLDYFNRQFGPKNGARHKKAKENFVSSLAAYSLVCYILQIKDRHNGNILVDI
jgi:phosphatidylinositol kinase/protein kinase (PI-3  family)